MPWGFLAPLGIAAGTFLYNQFMKETPKTSKRVEPPSFTSPMLKKAAGEATRLYERGEGFQPYPYNRVAPLSQSTQAGIYGLYDVAQRSSNPYVNQLMSQQLPSVQNVSDMASGKLIGNNPYVNTALQNALGTAATTINERMSAAGRYGSGAHTGALTEGLGSLAVNALLNQYNTDIGHMLVANKLMQQGNLGQMKAVGELAGEQSKAYINALQGAGLIDKQNQAQIQAAMDAWKENQQKNWMRLGAYSGLGKQLSEGYSTTTETGPKPSVLENLSGALNVGADFADLMGGIKQSTGGYDWTKFFDSFSALRDKKRKS